MAAGDRIYRSVFSSIKFFSKGWGPTTTLESLNSIKPSLNQTSCAENIVEHTHPIKLKKVADNSDGMLYEGTFLSPVATMLPGVLPKEAETARFELLIPKKWRGKAKPLYIHMAGTGDHYYWRRRYLFAFPLLKTGGIGSVILENPYYGNRKPRDQSRSQLHYVSDLLVMGLALIHESMVIGQWLEDQGLGPVGLTGVSMGGHNCALSASLWSKPVPVVPCLSWATASCVFTEGALKSAVCWKKLEEELFYCKLGLDERRRHQFNIISQRYGYPDMKSLLSHFSIPQDITNDRTVDNEEVKGQSSWLKLPKVKLKDDKKEKKFLPKAETVQMMQYVLDYSTHFNNYPRPVAPELATFLTAKEDLYIPRDNVADVRDLWPGCEVRYIDGGHVTSYLLQRNLIRQTQIEVMDKYQYLENGTEYINTSKRSTVSSSLDDNLKSQNSIQIQ